MTKKKEREKRETATIVRRIEEVFANCELHYIFDGGSWS